ncbi:MAG: hypothetical protein V4665_03385 [Patescibacteria group bacterium]
MDQSNTVQSIIDKPLFDPTYLNIEYVFNKIVQVARPIIEFFTNSHTWATIGLVSSLLSILAIAIIIFSLVRMREIQLHEKREIDHEIHEALARDAVETRNANPRWHYILTLIESPNESDWRVAIIESDTMLEEILREKGFEGTTVAELLEGARSSGYASIQNAWDAHVVRNQIAHQGSEFPLSQVEGRRVIKMFQNVFEEMGAI